VILLGIETSCDDTATAVVRDGRDVLSNVATNQDAFHSKYGGIVPEIASRQHLALLSAAVEDALERAGLTLAELDGIAVTAGPGLVGSLTIGVASAKALAYASGLPLYAVNHLHGHIFAAFLETDALPAYPFLALLVSGGHSQLVRVASELDLTVLGKTRDDAAGEAFDKTARLLGLPFPGGPAIDALARDGDPKAFAFPRHTPDTDAGRRANRADVAASFQAAIVDVLIDRLDRAYALDPTYESVVLAGGVAANSALQSAFRAWASRHHVTAHIPPNRYCTDNGAMIAAAGYRQRSALRVDARSLTANPNLPFSIAR